MIVVDLYSKEDCHLCAIAKETLIRIQLHHPFAFNVITLREGENEFDTFKERVPVVFINKTIAFQYHVPEEEFIAKLKRAANAV